MKALRFFIQIIILGTILMLPLLSISPARALPARLTGQERIISFNSLISISPDSSLTVTETITVEAAGYTIQHGIYRDFPDIYKNGLGLIARTGFNVVSVERDGHVEPYTIKAVANGDRIYMGDPDLTLQPGIYTYRLEYKTSNQLGYFADHDELYFNITGNHWQYPIEAVDATIELPAQLSKEQIQVDAFTGPAGATGKDWRSSITQAAGVTRVHLQTSRELEINEGLTAVVGWPKGLVNEPNLLTRVANAVIDNLAVVIGTAGVLCLGIYYLLVWIKVGRDPQSGVIIPQYTPPDKMPPTAMRYIDKMRYDNKAMTVAIVSMAVKGYLTINETGDTFSINRTDKNPTLTSDEQLLAHTFFNPGKSFKFTNKHHVTVELAKRRLKQHLFNHYGQVSLINNTRYSIFGILLAAVYLVVFLLLEFSFNHAINSVGELIFLTIWGVIVYTIFGTEIVHDWHKYFDHHKLFSSLFFSALWATIFGAFFMFFELVLLYGVAKDIGLLGLIITAATFVLHFFFGSALRARTVRGRMSEDKILGFKMFLTATETDRIQIMHRQLPKTLDTFETFLPYAIALDIEPAWSRQFKDQIEAAAQSAGSSGYAPVWYSGANFSGGTSLGGSFSTSIASAASAPSSSGSGFGGGGGSGGGGGGGGGGGW